VRVAFWAVIVVAIGLVFLVIYATLPLMNPLDPPLNNGDRNSSAEESRLDSICAGESGKFAAWERRHIASDVTLIMIFQKTILLTLQTI